MSDRILQLANQPYINGVGRRCPNYYGLAINLLLVDANIRPSFMFQPIDYESPSSARALLCRLLGEFPKDNFQVADCNQGTIYANRHNNDFLQRVQSYRESDDPAILGEILGYPEPGGHECAGSRYGCSVTIAQSSVYSTVITQKESLCLFRKQFSAISEFVKDRLGIKLDMSVNRMPSIDSF